MNGKNHWKQLIRGSFGEKDVIFANHPTDRSRAAIMLTMALESGVGFKTYCEAIETWLRKNLADRGVPGGRADEHIAEQMARVRDLSNYFDA